MDACRGQFYFHPELHRSTPHHTLAPGAAASPLTVTLLPRHGSLGFCSVAGEQRQLREMQMKRERRGEGATQGRRQPACHCCGSRIWALIKCSRGKKKKEMRFVGFLPWQFDENVREISPWNLLFISQCVRRTQGTVNERTQRAVREFYRASLPTPDFEDRYVFQHVSL